MNLMQRRLLPRENPALQGQPTWPPGPPTRVHRPQASFALRSNTRVSQRTAFVGRGTEYRRLGAPPVQRDWGQWTPAVAPTPRIPPTPRATPTPRSRTHAPSHACAQCPATLRVPPTPTLGCCTQTQSSGLISGHAHVRSPTRASCPSGHAQHAL